MAHCINHLRPILNTRYFLDECRHVANVMFCCSSLRERIKACKRPCSHTLHKICPTLWRYATVSLDRYALEKYAERCPVSEKRVFDHGLLEGFV